MLMHHALEVTVTSSFFLVVMVTIWILMHKRQMVEADQEAKTEMPVGMLYGWLSQCVVLSFPYRTLFKWKQRCHGSFSCSTAREIAVLPTGKMGRRIFPPLPKTLLCKTCMTWVRRASGRECSPRQWEWGEQLIACHVQLAHLSSLWCCGTDFEGKEKKREKVRGK